MRRVPRTTRSEPKSDWYQAVAARLAERDSRDNQREAVLRVIVPLLTALPKARLTALI
jgi:cytidylate kinase